MPTTVRSHAKINLGLGIGAPRPDGFHALATVYQTLEMHDLVTVTVLNAERMLGLGRINLWLTSNDGRVPTDRRNTAFKMVTLALRGLGISASVEIHIEKKLPVQGGLGAGSANAVAALVGLERELAIWEQKRQEDSGLPPFRQKGPEGWGGLSVDAGWGARRLEIAALVGSDVPLFLIGGTVLGLDRGQEVYPLPDIEPVWCVVATPSIGVSTPQAFRDWDELCLLEGLTAETSADKLKELSRAYASAFAEAIPQAGQAGSSGVPPIGGDLAGPQESALVRTGITSWIANDFERVVFRQHPSLAEIKRLLAGPDGTPEAACPDSCLLASLSGSGSALFGLYLTRETAEAACARLQAAGIASTLTRTLPRPDYWGQMLQP